MTLYSLTTKLEDVFYDALETLKAVSNKAECKLINCFPLENVGTVEIDGSLYEMSIKIGLKQIK